MAAFQDFHVNCDSEFYSTDVYTAASIGDIDFCLEYTRSHQHASLDTSNKSGWTALMYACAYGHCVIASLLISCGCQAKRTTPDGVTPLMLSIKSGDSSVFELLLSVSDLDSVDHRGWSAVFYAVSFNRYNCLQKLVTNGANIHLTDHLNQTPLQLAVSSGIEPITIFLLERVVYLNGSLPDKQRLCQLAKETENANILNIIMDHGTKMKHWNAFLSPSNVATAEVKPQSLRGKSPLSKGRQLLDFSSPRLSYSPNQQRPPTKYEAVHDFLKKIGLEKYYPIFRDEEVDFEVLLTLNEDHLKEMGIKLLGPRRKIYMAIQRYRGVVKA